MAASPLYTPTTTAEAVSELIAEQMADAEAEIIARRSRARWVYTQRFGVAMMLVTGILMLIGCGHLIASFWGHPA